MKTNLRLVAIVILVGGLAGCSSARPFRWPDAIEMGAMQTLAATVDAKRVPWNPFADNKPAPKLEKPSEPGAVLDFRRMFLGALERIPSPPPAPQPAAQEPAEIAAVEPAPQPPPKNSSPPATVAPKSTRGREARTLPQKGPRLMKAGGGWEDPLPYIPVVWVFHQKEYCPPYERWYAWLLSLTDEEYAALPIVFLIRDDFENYLDYQRAWPCPSFHYNRPDGSGRVIKGWDGARDFFAKLDADIHPNAFNATPQASPIAPQQQPSSCGPGGCGPQFKGKGKKGKWMGSAAPVGGQTLAVSIPGDWIDYVLTYIGGGDVRISDNLAVRIPSGMGFTLTREGDKVTARMTEPLPWIRLKWGILRYDDRLVSASVTPTAAAVELATIGTIPIERD